MTQHENHTELEFTDSAQLARDLDGEPMSLGRDAEGHQIALHPFHVTYVAGARTGKTQTRPTAPGETR